MASLEVCLHCHEVHLAVQENISDDGNNNENVT